MESTTQNHPSTTQNWADLPKDVLYIIAYNLDYMTDLTRLRGVCPSWRKALRLADFPLPETHYVVPHLDNCYRIYINNSYSNNNKALVSTLEYANNKIKPLYLLKTRYFLIYPLLNGPSFGGWIARMGQLGLNKWRLLSPLHTVAAVLVNEQRYLYTDPQIIGEINLLDHRVVELARPMSLVYDLNYNAQPISKKVVEGERAVLVLHGNVLMLWRLGDRHWFRFEYENDGKIYCCKDVEFHNGKFYAFWASMRYQFEVWVIYPGDLSTKKQEINVRSILQVNEGRRYGCTDASFVSSKSNGCLYVVIHVYGQEIVLLLREEKDKMMNKWERVKNMENMTFFIGGNVSFALPPPPTNLVPWIPNSIYFFNTSATTIHVTEYSNVGVVSWDPRYMMKRLEYFPLVFYPSYINYVTMFIMDEDYDKDALIVSFDKCRELCTKFFFPPPSWVKWRCPSRGNVEISLDQFM